MEKRWYQREKLNIDGVFFIQGAKIGKIEFVGMIKDISEGGLAIRVKDEQYIDIADEAEIGTTIRYFFIDEYEVFGEQKNPQLVGDVTVVRKSKEHGELILGCTINYLSSDLESYISDRKVLAFFDKGCQK